MNLLSWFEEKYVDREAETGEEIVILDCKRLPVSFSELMKCFLEDLNYFLLFSSENYRDLTIYYQLEDAILFAGVYSRSRKKRLTKVRVISIPEQYKKLEDLLKGGCNL